MTNEEMADIFEILKTNEETIEIQKSTIKGLHETITKYEQMMREIIDQTKEESKELKKQIEENLITLDEAVNGTEDNYKPFWNAKDDAVRAVFDEENS